VSAPDLPMVDVRVVFDAGSTRDGDKPGLSQLTNGLLTEGAGEWNADQIAQRMDAVGASMGSGALRDMAWVSLRTLTEEDAFNTSVSTLAEILNAPTFPVAALERNRKMMLAVLQREAQSPGGVVKKEFMKKVFGSHPYAIHSGGTKESLTTITRDDVMAQYRRYYVAGNTTISIVGALDRKQAEDLANRLTDRMQEGKSAPALPAVDTLLQASEQHIQFPSSQSHIVLGQPGMKRGDPDYFALYVGNHILGGGGLVSLLSDEVREKRGLSYSIYSYFSPMRANGPFVLGAQTKNQQASEALKIMRQTLVDYIQRGPTDKELKAAKQNITGGFPLRIANNGKINSVTKECGVSFHDRFLPAAVGLSGCLRGQDQFHYQRADHGCLQAPGTSRAVRNRGSGQWKELTASHEEGGASRKPGQNYWRRASWA